MTYHRHVGDELAVVGDLLAHEGFQAGLLAGLIGLVLIILVSVARRSPVIGWGILFSASVVVVLVLDDRVEWALVTGLAIVAVGGVTIDLAGLVKRRSVSYLAKGTAWGIAVIAVFWFTNAVYSPVERWISIAFPLVILLIGASVSAFRRSAHPNLLGPMVAVSILGIWVTVPETDSVTVLVGAAFPLGLATVPPFRARAISAGAFALGSVIAWLTAVGGESNAATIVGGWSAIGIIPLLPLLAHSHRPARWTMVLSLHVVYVVLVTRAVDVWDSIPALIAATLVLSVLSTLALILWGRSGDRASEDLATKSP